MASRLLISRPDFCDVSVTSPVYFVENVKINSFFLKL